MASVEDDQPFGLRRFTNAVRIMRSIDEFELSDEGAISSLSQWRLFRSDPFGFLIHADDSTAAKIWAIVERRQAPELRS